MSTSFEKNLQYTFADHSLLERALTHRSEARLEHHSYEALETLGDALISLLAVKYAFDKLAEPTPQDMTRLRSAATRNATLAKIGGDMDIQGSIRMIDASYQSSGNDGVIADCVEAIFGAMWLDSNLSLDPVQRLFNTYFHKYIEKPPSRCVDAKTRLQIYCQQRYKSPPKYLLVTQEGPAHQPVFTMQVQHSDDLLVKGVGVGATKRESETAAAAEAIKALESTGHKALSMSPADSRRRFSSSSKIDL